MTTINPVGNFFIGGTGTEGSPFVGNNSPIIITPTLTGITNGSSAASGNVGEVISSSIGSGSAISLTSDVGADITSISLTAGDWEVFGQVQFLADAATTSTYFGTGISLFSGVLADAADLNQSVQVITGTFPAGTEQVLSAGKCLINVTTTTAVYLVVHMVFAVSTASAYGSIQARRIR